MNDAFTRHALDIFLDVSENDSNIIRCDIEDTTDNTSPKLWRETNQRYRDWVYTCFLCIYIS